MIPPGEDEMGEEVVCAEYDRSSPFSIAIIDSLGVVNLATFRHEFLIMSRETKHCLGMSMQILRPLF